MSYWVWTIAKGVALGQLLLVLAGVALYLLGAWAYARWIRRGRRGQVSIAAAVMALVLVGVIAVLARAACSPSEPKLQRQATALDTAFARDTAQLARDTAATNSTLLHVLVPAGAGTLFAPVHQERRSWKRALKTSQAQTANRDKQIRALTPRLRVFAELHGVATGDRPILDGTLSAQAGVILRLKQGLEAEVYVDRPLLGRGGTTLNAGIRKSWRIF